MRVSRITFALTLIVPIIIIIVAYFYNTIDVVGKLNNETMTYILSTTTVLLSLFTAWMALKVFRLSVVQLRFNASDANSACMFYNLVCTIRLIILLMVIIVDLATYYLTGTQSSLYLAAIVYIATLFCWPRKSELESLNNLPR